MLRDGQVEDAVDHWAEYGPATGFVDTEDDFGGLVRMEVRRYRGEVGVGVAGEDECVVDGRGDENIFWWRLECDIWCIP